MTVFVDDMFSKPMGRFRRMNMSHMVADTEEELHTMADTIGVKRKWYQGDHYDICFSKRKEAIKAGAVEVTMRTLGFMRLVRRTTGVYPKPQEAQKVYDRLRALRTQ